jgi:hypothetical protein
MISGFFGGIFWRAVLGLMYEGLGVVFGGEI